MRRLIESFLRVWKNKEKNYEKKIKQRGGNKNVTYKGMKVPLVIT